MTPRDDGTGLRVTLDIWHPDCWTLAVTEDTDAGLLGHGVYTIDGSATGRFTVYGETDAEIEDLEFVYTDEVVDVARIVAGCVSLLG